MSYTSPIELYVIIEDIVDSIRSTGSVSAYVEVSGTYTITTDNTLVNNDYITIDSIGYKVSNVSITGFTIKGATGLNFTNAEWKANAPYFMCEKEAKAGNILTEKTKQDTYKWQKYPLFLLSRPYTDDRDNRMIGYSTDFSLHIITDTESTYWSDDRIDNNFTPTLYPLYNSFMNALPLNRWVKEKYLEKITHSKTDSMFIDANPFPDKMDGLTIEFTDLEILKNTQVCEPVSPEIYEIDLSSTTGGSATSSLGDEGVYTVNKNDNEAFCATADTNFEFSRWLINGIENLTNPLAILIKKNYDIVAEFISSLLTIQDVFSTEPIQIGKNWAFENQADLPSLKNYNLIFYGDSVTASISCGTDKMYPQLCTTNLNTNTDYDFHYINNGVGGYTMQDCLDNYNTLVQPFKSTTREDLLIIFAFANGTDTAQQKNDELKDIVDLAHADGIKTLVMTATGSDSGAQQILIEEANDILRGDNSFSDYYYDLAAVPTLSPLVNPTTTCDAVHPNSDTKQLIADSVSDYIETNVITTFSTNNAAFIKNTKVWKTNGINERAFIVKNSSLDLSTNEFTIIGNVKIGVDAIIGTDRQGGGNWWNATLGPNYLSFTTNHKTFTTGIIKGDVSNLDRFVPFAISRRTGGFVDFYLDGILLSSNVGGNVDLTSVNPVVLSSYSTFVYSSMEYSEFMIFNNRALTEEEVYKVSINESIDMTNCVLDIDFNFGLDAILYDKSLESNNMTVVSSNPDDMFINSDEIPKYLTDGGTLFTRDLDSKKVTATYKNNGTPNLNTILGYSKVDDYPIGSGLLNNDNTILGILHDDWELNEKTFTEIYNEPETETYITTKPTTNNISQLIIKE